MAPNKYGKGGKGRGEGKPREKPVRGGETKHLKKKDQAEYGRNTAYERSWNGFDFYQSACGRPMLAKPFISGLMSGVMAKKGDLIVANGCVPLALLAHAHNPKMIAFADDLDWQPYSFNEMVTILNNWCKKFDRKAVVYGIGESKSMRFIKHLKTCGEADSTPSKFLLVKGKNSNHLLPTAGVSFDWVELLPDQSEEPTDGQTVPESVAAPTLAIEEAPAPKAAEEKAVSSTQPGPKAAEDEVLAGCLDGYYPVKNLFLRKSLSPHSPLEYDFVVALEDKLFRPDFAHSTLGLAEKHLDLVRYIEVKEQKWVTKLSDLPRMYTDGFTTFECFSEGDVLDFGNSKYKAVPDTFHGVACLRLLRVDTTLGAAAGKAIRSLFGSFVDATPRSPKVLRPVKPISAADEEFARWQFGISTSSDPLVASVARRMRDHRVHGDDVPERTRPDQEIAMLAMIRQQYGDSLIAGRFGWGYCYCCGLELPAKRMKCRVCEGCSIRSPNPTPLTTAAAMMLEYQRPTTEARPIVYPGLVQLECRHPPLKEAETVAVEGQNFCVAPKGLGTSCPATPLDD